MPGDKRDIDSYDKDLVFYMKLYSYKISESMKKVKKKKKKYEKRMVITQDLPNVYNVI